MGLPSGMADFAPCGRLLQKAHSVSLAQSAEKIARASPDWFGFPIH